MKPSKLWQLFISLCLCGALFVCGDDGDSDTGGSDGALDVDSVLMAEPDPDEGMKFATLIPATKGGSVTTESGKASLMIPAGALDDDVEITVEVKPPGVKTASNIYEFGPGGTEFGKEAELSIAYDKDPGADKEAVLGLKNQKDGTWEKLPGSKQAAGMVTGKVGHLSEFAVILLNTGGDVDTGSGRPDLELPLLDPLDGTWVLQSAECDGVVQDLDGSQPVIVFDGVTGTSMDTISESCQISVEISVNYPGTPEDSMVEWIVSMDDFICEGTDCPESCPPVPPDVELPTFMLHEATYVLDGSTLILTEDPAPEEEYLCGGGTLITTWSRQD